MCSNCLLDEKIICIGEIKSMEKKICLKFYHSISYKRSYFIGINVTPMANLILLVNLQMAKKYHCYDGIFIFKSLIIKICKFV